jgi:hypothetical protein
VSFRAPVAIHDARLAYQLVAHFGRSCRTMYLVEATRRDVPRGARVRLTATPPARCRGPLRGTVALVAAQTGIPRPMAPVGDGSALVVGRFSRHVP